MQGDREEWTVAEYLDAANRGDPMAHGRLDRCAKRLAAAKAKALGLSREDAEDAAQQVCALALGDDGAALARVGRASTRLSVWVAGVLKHLLTDLVKSRASTERVSPGDRASQRAAQRLRVAGERTARLPPEGPCPGKLTVARQQALRLHLQGFSDSEISARLGISRDAARDRVRGAWEKLGAQTRPSVRVQATALLAAGWRPPHSTELETLVALTNGQSYRQIAIERDEALETVRSRVRRALRRALNDPPQD